MIIKSMSRKQATFSQLVDYFEDGRQDEKYSIFHNLYSTNAEAIKEEFTTNANFLPKRKNGVYMYHEILSITQSEKLSREQQKEILKDIGLEYIKNRADKNLVYAVLHDDKDDNLHYHFMISSNELMSEKRLRLSKEQFSQFKKDLELKVLNNYPELEQKKLINKEKGASKDSGEKLSNKGVELKRRTGKTTQRDDLKDRLKTVFAGSKNKAEFFSLLEKENLSIYVNGNTIGIVDKATDRKHRLKTLGMLDEFNAISQVIESAEAKKQQAEPEPEKTNSHTVNKAFSKERINTGFYHQQQEKPTEKPNEAQPETAEQKKPAQDFSKEKINTYGTQQKESKQDDLARDDRKRHYSLNKTKTYEPKTDVELEIERRKKQMQKERENEADYSNDYSKGR